MDTIANHRDCTCASCKKDLSKKQSIMIADVKERDSRVKVDLETPTFYCDVFCLQKDLNTSLGGGSIH